MSFTRLVLRNLQRNGIQSLLATLGIVLGVGVWLFFAALSTGLQENVLNHIVSDRFVEVVPRTVQLAGVQRRGGIFGGSGSGLDKYTLEDLQKIDGVKNTFPKQQLGFPATVRGGKSIIGEDMWADLMADGIEASLVDLTPDNRKNAFVDWSAISTCSADEACGDGAVCTDGRCVRQRCTPDDELWWNDTQREATNARLRAGTVVFGRERPQLRRFEDDGSTRWAVTVRGGVEDEWRDQIKARGIEGERPPEASCPGESYCDAAQRRCEMPVPVILSPSLLELYNGNVQSMLRGTKIGTKPPRLSEDALIGFKVRAELGVGMLGRAVGVEQGEQSVREVPLKLAGFSPLAIALGATIPRGYIERWNAEYGEASSANDYSAILVELERASNLNTVIDSVRDDLNLDVHPRHEAARRAAGMLSILLIIFGVLAAGIVAVGAMHIAQTAALRNQARRREFGVMRSVGASSGDILWMLMAEAAILGAIAGAIAFPAAWGVTEIADWIFVTYAPDFPFKPETLFAFRWAWWGISVALAVGAAVLGALLPAIRVARLDPAEALRAHGGDDA